jgi:hypothetical protein
MHCSIVENTLRRGLIKIVNIFQSGKLNVCLKRHKESEKMSLEDKLGGLKTSRSEDFKTTSSNWQKLESFESQKNPK